MVPVESRLSATPPFLKLSKNPGPTCKPIMKTKRISPKSWTKVRMFIGAVKPMWPATMPANSTKVTPKEMPHTLILPNSTPIAMTIENSRAMCATESCCVNKFKSQSINY